MAPVKCTTCGRFNAIDADACRYCTRRLRPIQETTVAQKPIRCTTCGRFNAVGTETCEYCLREVRPTEEAAASEPPRESTAPRRGFRAVVYPLIEKTFVWIVLPVSMTYAGVTEGTKWWVRHQAAEQEEAALRLEAAAVWQAWRQQVCVVSRIDPPKKCERCRATPQLIAEALGDPRLRERMEALGGPAALQGGVEVCRDQEEPAH